MSLTTDHNYSADSVALQPFTAALLECVSVPDVIAVVVQRGCVVLGAQAGLVALLSSDGHALDIVREGGYAQRVAQRWKRFPMDLRSPLNDAVRSGKAVYLEGRAAWTQLYPHLADRVEDRFGTAVALPLAARQKMFGGLHFTFSAGHVFSDADRVFLDEIARQCAIALDRALLLASTQSAHTDQSFLVQATAILSESLDYASRLESLTHLCVPTLSDWAGIDVVAEDGSLVRLSVAHRQPELESAMRETQRRFPPKDDSPILRVIRTGEPWSMLHIPIEALEQGVLDTDHLQLLQKIGIGAILCLPLVARGRTLGALTLGMAPEGVGSGRTFTPAAIVLATELSRRAGVALDNAKLFLQVEQAQKHSDETAEALRASEGRYRQLLATALEGVLFIDAQRTITYVNPRLATMLGYETPEELIGENGLILTFPEDESNARGRWETRLQGAQGEYELRLRRKDNTSCWTIAHVSVEKDAHTGDFAGTFTMVTDITERRRTQEEKAGLVAELQEASVRQRRFLREMLAILTEGHLRLCDAPQDLPAPLPLVGEPISLAHASLRQLRRAVEAAADELGMSKERMQDLLTAAGEATMNAVVHAGGGEGEVRSDAEKGIVQIWVHDQGKGIAEDALHRATLEKGYSSAGTLGHGFWMMLKTADHIYLLTGPAGTTVVLEQFRAPAEPAWLASYT